LTYDSSNRLIKVTYPDGGAIEYKYDSSGRMTEIINERGIREVLIEYDSNNRVIKQTYPDGGISTFSYTIAGGFVTESRETAPNGGVTAQRFNNWKYIIEKTTPDGATTYERQAGTNLLLSVTDPLGNTFSIAYNTLGMVEKITDAKGNVTLYNYDVMGRVGSVADPMDGLTKYFYDTKDNLVMLIDARNNMIRYEYDDRDRITKMIDQMGRTETYAYYRGSEITPSTGDNLKSITDRKGQTTTYNQYDLMNRPKKITYNDGSFTEYTYDKVGRVDYINDSISGFIDPTYNDFGCSACTGRGLDRISKEVTPLGTIDYTYDKAGRRLSMTVAGQNVVNYVYDAAGRMTSISQKIGTKTRTYPFTYDNGSRRTSLKMPLSANNKFVTTTYGYDTANRLLSMLHQNPTAQIENLVYEYDENSNRRKFTRNATLPLRTGVDSATYDNANEMLTFTPASATTRNMTYDNNGNMTSVTNNCGVTNYTWNARNQLVGINGFTAACGSLTANFKYDALGRRIEKTISGITTRYLYDGLDIIQEKNASNAVTANYIRTLNIDESLTRITSQIGSGLYS
jgi:YD repeat-containing protein